LDVALGTIWRDALLLPQSAYRGGWSRVWTCGYQDHRPL